MKMKKYLALCVALIPLVMFTTTPAQAATINWQGGIIEMGACGNNPSCVDPVMDAIWRVSLPCPEIGTCTNTNDGDILKAQIRVSADPFGGGCTWQIVEHRFKVVTRVINQATVNALEPNGWYVLCTYTTPGCSTQ